MSNFSFFTKMKFDYPQKHERGPMKNWKSQEVEFQPGTEKKKVYFEFFLWGSSSSPAPTAPHQRSSMQIWIGLDKIFIPRREVLTHCPDGVHLKVFPIYIALVNENWGFKNTNVNRPFSSRRKPSLSGWVGRWVGGWWYFGSFDFSQNRV